MSTNRASTVFIDDVWLSTFHYGTAHRNSWARDVKTAGKYGHPHPQTIIFCQLDQLYIHVTRIIVNNYTLSGSSYQSLTLFYKSRNVPLMIYAAPCWYPLLGKTDKKRLDKYEGHGRRLVYPNHESADSRLDTAGPVNVSKQLENQFHRYTKRIRTDTSHAPHENIKIGGHFSSRSG